MIKFILFNALITCITAAGMKPPTETAGINPEVVHVNNLAVQISTTADDQLGGSKITFTPNAIIKEHSYAFRPGIVYVVPSEIVVVDNGVKETFSVVKT